jgi:predicted patatin/cPLA2 family phospholipase
VAKILTSKYREYLKPQKDMTRKEPLYAIIIGKMLRLQNKEKILKNAREKKKQLNSISKHIRITSDLSAKP